MLKALSRFSASEYPLPRRSNFFSLSFSFRLEGSAEELIVLRQKKDMSFRHEIFRKWKTVRLQFHKFHAES